MKRLDFESQIKLKLTLIAQSYSADFSLIKKPGHKPGFLLPHRVYLLKYYNVWCACIQTRTMVQELVEARALHLNGANIQGFQGGHFSR